MAVADFEDSRAAGSGAGLSNASRVEGGVRPQCAFCGLPLPPPIAWSRRGPRSEEPSSAPDYCCTGCQFAAEVTQARGDVGEARWTLARLGIAIFCSMNVMAFTMALWTRDVYGDLASDSLVGPWEGLLRAAGLLFTVPVLGLLGLPLAESAWDNLQRGRLSTDLLLCAGVLAAFLVSAHSVWTDRGPVYFEVACVILVMVTLGRWLEAQGRLQAGVALDQLARLLPDTVRVLSAEGLVEQTALARVLPGQVIQVLPGERIPLDGRLVSGVSQVDEQLITGESLPATRQPGERLWAGTLLLDCPAQIEVLAPANEGALQRIIDFVRAARLAKGPYQELTDRISAGMFPVIAAVALAALVWHTFQGGWRTGWLAGLSVVLVACPCALGLATPLAVWTGLAAAARRQVLFRSGEAIERLATIRGLCFDKTGTLTTGRPQVIRLEWESDRNHSRGEALARVLTAQSNHPFSQAILGAFAKESGQSRDPQFEAEPTAEGLTGRSWTVRQVAGQGLQGESTAGDRCWLGNQALMSAQGQHLGPRLAGVVAETLRDGLSFTLLAWNGEVRAAWVFDEELRGGVREMLDWCEQQHLKVQVLTGDHPARGARLARDLQVPVQAGLLPEDKARAITDAHQRWGSVAMVGDGVNDAPALAASDLGVALGCGTDISRDSSQVCLLSSELDRIPWAIGFYRRLVRTIRGNLWWAFAYNVVGVALACSGRLNPALAALLMVISSVLVILAALRAGRLDELELAPLGPPAETELVPLAKGESPTGNWPSVNASAPPPSVTGDHHA
ncbi:MAG: heavy metal translocating P-type ATPase [Planctomycetaceae bacterium]